MKKIFTFFAAMALAAGVSAQTADYELMGFVDESEEQNFITELNLSMTDTLSVNLAIINNGPEQIANTDSLLFDLSINGMELGAAGWQGSELAADGLLEVGTGWLGTFTIFDAETMDTYVDIIGTQFELCFTVRTKVATDPDASNNTACVTVNRGVSGINEIAEGEVSVYPNPATTVINVANAEGAQVSVFDMSGRMVANVESANANEAINVANLAKGMYIVRIVDGQNVTTKKVSIAR